MERVVHHIKQQIFDVNVQNAEHANEIQQMISKMAKTDLNLIVERLLDLFSIENHDIKIEKLQLDLGEIDLLNLTNELPIRFEKILYETLLELIPPAEILNVYTSDNITIKSRNEAKIDIISFFLKYGRFPWWTSKSNYNFDTLFTQQLAENPNSIVQLLQIHRYETSFFTRLSLQVSSVSLFQLIKYVQKEQATSIHVWINNQEDRFKGSFTAKQAYRRQMLREVLSYIFQHRGNFSLEKFKTEIEPKIFIKNSGYQSDSREDETIEIRANTKLENIEFFLQHGRIHKDHAQTPLMKDLESDLLEFSQKIPEQIRKILFAIKNPLALSKRLYEQFSYETSHKVIILLAASQERAVRQILDQILDHYWTFRASLKLTNYTTFKKEMYIASLNFLLNSSGKVNKEQLFNFLANNIGKKQGIKIDIVKYHLAQAFENENQDTIELNPWQALQIFFTQGTFPKVYIEEKRNPAEVLKDLMLTRPERVAGFFFQFQDAPTIAKRLVELLQETEISNLLKILDTENYVLIRVLLEELKEKITRNNLNLENFEHLATQYIIAIILEGKGKENFEILEKKLAKSLRDAYHPSSKAIERLFPIGELTESSEGERYSIALERVYHFLRYGSFPMWDQNLQSSRFSLEIVELLQNEPLELKALLREIEIDEAIDRLYDHLDSQTLDALLALMTGLKLAKFSEIFHTSIDKLGRIAETAKIRRELLERLISIPTPMRAEELRTWLGESNEEVDDLSKQVVNKQNPNIQEYTVDAIPQALIGFVDTIKILLERLKDRISHSSLTKFKLEDVITNMVEKNISFTPASLIAETIDLLTKKTAIHKRVIVSQMKTIVNKAIEKDEHRFYPLVDLVSAPDGISSKTEEEIIEPKVYSELEQLQFFIENGRIVSADEALSISQLEALILELLDRGSSQITGILGGAPIPRLIHQFSEEVLVKWAVFQQLKEEIKIKAIIALLAHIFQENEKSLEGLEKKLFIWRSVLETLTFFRTQPEMGELHLMRTLVAQMAEIWKVSHQDIRMWVEASIPMLAPEEQATIILTLQEEQVFPSENTASMKDEQEEAQHSTAAEETETKLSYLSKIIVDLLPNTKLQIKEEQEFNELFRELLIKDNKKLIGELRSTLEDAKPQTLESFVMLTRKENLLFLLSEWFPTHLGFMKSLMSVLEDIYERHPLIFSTLEDSKLIQWVPILNFALDQQKDKEVVNELFKTSLDYIEQVFSISRIEVVQFMGEIITEKRANTDLSVLENLIEVEQKTAKEGEPNIEEKQDSFSFDVDAFISLLNIESMSKEWEIMERKLLLGIDKSPNRMRMIMFNLLGVSERRIQIINKFSDESFWAIVNVFQPNLATDIQKWISDLEQLLNRKAIKEQLLYYLYETNLASFDLLDFTEQLFKHVTNKQEQYIKLLESSIRFLEVANLPTKSRWLKIFKELLRPEINLKKNTPKVSQNIPKETVDEKIYISNAGLVILWPFFTRYFQASGLTQARKFKDEQAAERAAHLLQFLVSGNTETPEHELILNKILCGIPLSRPIPAGIEMTEDEMDMSKKVLLSAVANWEKMKNLPIGNLRGSFLLREGRLEENFENWQLVIEPKPFDLLLDSLPWTISSIKLPWMPKILNVEWR